MNCDQCVECNLSMCASDGYISKSEKLWGISRKHSSSLHLKGFMCEVVVLCSSKNARQFISWHEGGRTAIRILLFFREE